MPNAKSLLSTSTLCTAMTNGSSSHVTNLGYHAAAILKTFVYKLFPMKLFLSGRDFSSFENIKENSQPEISQPILNKNDFVKQIWPLSDYTATRSDF